MVFNGQKSELKLIRCDVAQGFILRPLLFLLYINDLTKVLSFIMPILFADDTNFFFCTGTELKEMIRQVNEEMAKIYGWVNANRLSLNIDKTNFMLFTPKNFYLCTDDFVINQIKIQELKETRFLGVIIDNKLNWSFRLLKILVSYWSQEKFLTMRPCSHCITALYTLIFSIAYMCGARHTILILMILLFYRTKPCV